MKQITYLLFMLCTFGLAGCVTNDFKVVDSLRIGMTAPEAKATIHEYGFEMAQSINRPADGWPSERAGFTAADWRAGREESRGGKRVAFVEYYPVGHGLLGAGELFLFYGDDGRLMHFYRYQIN